MNSPAVDPIETLGVLPKFWPSNVIVGVDVLRFDSVVFVIDGGLAAVDWDCIADGNASVTAIADKQRSLEIVWSLERVLLM
jgi:hypothetical protein